MFDNCKCGRAFLKVEAPLTDWFCLVIPHASSLLKDIHRACSDRAFKQTAHCRFQSTDIASHHHTEVWKCYQCQWGGWAFTTYYLHFDRETCPGFGSLFHSEITGGQSDPQTSDNAQFSELPVHTSLWCHKFQSESCTVSVWLTMTLNWSQVRSSQKSAQAGRLLSGNYLLSLTVVSSNPESSPSLTPQASAHSPPVKPDHTILTQHMCTLYSHPLCCIYTNLFERLNYAKHTTHRCDPASHRHWWHCWSFK